MSAWGVDPVHVDAAAFMALQGEGARAVDLRLVKVQGSRAYLGLFQVNASNLQWLAKGVEAGIALRGRAAKATMGKRKLFGN